MDFHNSSCTTSSENAKVTGVRISCHVFVMLLPYRVKVSDTKVTHFTQYYHFAHVYIDHIYGNQYRWNKQTTAESQSLKIYVENVHHSCEHMHSNDYAIAQSLPWWWCGPAASTPSADVLSTPSHHGSANGRPSLKGYPRCCSSQDSNLANWVATSLEG